jgi:Cellulase (glycosyl hydrolase family 5)
VVDSRLAGTPHRFEPGSARGLRKRGTWFRDEAHRYVLFRGVNLGPRSKLPPYLPVYPLSQRTLRADPEIFAAELARVRPRLALLPRLGINAVRLLVMWKGVEPSFPRTPGVLEPEGTAYLERVRDLLLELRALGLFVFIDIHQDLAHEAYGGDGFPDWALAVDSEHPLPEHPPKPGHTWALNYYDVWLAKLLGLSPSSSGVRHTLRSFWENRLDTPARSGYRLQEHYVKTLGAMAAFFMGQPQARDALLGYEPFNEPHQVGLDKQVFESQTLPGFYEALLKELRAHDRDALLFVQPRVDWTIYPLEGEEFHWFNHTLEPTTALGLHDADDRGLVFSFHYYDPYLVEQAAQELWLYRWLAGDTMPDKVHEWPRVFERMQRAARSREMVPFLTEFGASQDWIPPEFVTRLRPLAFEGSLASAYTALQLEEVERHLLNSTYWNFDLYNTVEEGDHFNQENFSLLGPDWSVRHARIFARPYPMRSSAEPELLWFGLESEHCAIVLKGEVVAPDAPTVVFVPRDYHYFKGFEVRATVAAAGRGVEWDAERGLLSWWPDPKRDAHVLVLSPSGEFDRSVLPARARELSDSAPLLLGVP